MFHKEYIFFKKKTSFVPFILMQESNQLLLNAAYTLHNPSDFLMKNSLF